MPGAPRRPFLFAAIVLIASVCRGQAVPPTPTNETLGVINQRLDDMEKSEAREIAEVRSEVAAQFAASKEAINIANEANQVHLSSLNEIRGTLADEQTKLMPRAEADERFNAMNASISDLKDRLNVIDGRSSGTASWWGYAIGAAGAIALIYPIMSKRGPAAK